MKTPGNDEKIQGHMSPLRPKAQVSRLLLAIRRGRLGSLQEWMSVVLIFLALGITVWSIEHARWIKPQPSLTTVLGFSILGCLLLVKSRIPTWATYLLMVILGLAVAVWQSASLFLSTEARSALQSWWQAISSGQLNEGTVYFAIFLILTTWLVGFISTWFVLRRRNVWIAVSLGTITVLLNLSNLPHDYYYFLPLYLLVAMLLIVQVNLAGHGGWFGKRSTISPYRGTIYAMGAVLLVIVLTVVTAWVVPQPPIEQLGLRTSTGTSRKMDIQEQWFNIFADVPAKWSLIQSSEQETLLFQDSIGGGNQIQFVITSERSGYWRTRRYDTYHSWGWTNSVTSGQMLDAGAAVNGGDELLKSNTLVYTVENRIKTDVILTGGEFVSVNIPVLIKTLSADESVADSPVPSASQSVVTEAHKIEAEGQDIMTVVSPWILSPYQHYTVVAQTNSVTADELAQAGEDYPPEVTDYYLRLPDTLPERTEQLSQILTKEAGTPYDKVIAIKGFLNQLKYNRKGATAPEGVDGVDYFLFEAEEGVCISFASAMAVMLRSVGVPTRICTGYFRGELDEDTGNLIVRSRNFHAWIEVYFPDYGWIEFEATPTSEPANEEEILGVGGSFLDIRDEEEFDLFVGSVPSDVGYTPRSRPKVWVYFTVISILLFVGFAARLAFGRWLEHLQRVQTASEAYARMCYLASLGRRGPLEQETPGEYCARLAVVFPVHAGAIDVVTQAYLETRYSSRKELGETGKIRLQKTWVLLCPFLLKRALRLGRRSG